MSRMDDVWVVVGSVSISVTSIRNSGSACMLYEGMQALVNALPSERILPSNVGVEVAKLPYTAK